MHDIETRLARLEKSAARWRAAALSLVMLISGLAMMGQITIRGGGPGGGGMQAPQVTANRITARESITLTDSNGNDRLVISTDKATDNPSLEIKDPNGKTLLSLSSHGKAASLLIQDATGKKLFSAP